MPVNRLFYEGDLSVGAVRLEGEEARHLIKVLRAQVGDAVELVNGRNVLADAAIHAIDGKDLVLDVESVRRQPPLAPTLVLYQALPKLTRLDFILEKATELGVHQIHLFPGSRSEVPSLKASAQRRTDALLRAAVKQCGRLDLPELHQAGPISSWKSLPNVSYFGDLRPDTPDLKKAWKPDNAVAFIIGPESGLTEAEMNQLEQLGASGIRLSPHILRTDTAALAALSIAAQWLWG